MRLQSRAIAALAATALAATMTSCGFNEELTSRGFVKAGDGLCGAAIGRAFLAREGAPSGAGGLDPEGIATLARGYAGIAAVLRRLDIRDEDEAMRDEIVRRYTETASQIRGIAADAAAGDPAAPAQAVAAIDELQPFAAELRDYGFRVCGGREPA
ncbi:MAG: hypothetical protein ACRDKH_05170 [Solirubrobacterales bacterium]